MDNAIDIAALSKRYGTVHALKDISTAILQGQVIGLLGHNGAGKSTLIKLILGLSTPSSGTINVLGHTPWGTRAASLRRRMGYLPEQVAFYGNLSGREVLHYLADLKHADRRQADRLLERVGLDHAAARRVATYSKGMRQRLGLAQALLGNPEVIVLDEPTTGLDPQATRDLYAIVAALRAEARCVLISSHLLAELEPHIDGAWVLREGALIAAGSVMQLRAHTGLPSLIVTRLKQGIDRTLLGRVLNDLALSHCIRPDGRCEMHVSADNKLRLIGNLTAYSLVEDMEAREPGLVELYNWLGTHHPAATVCA